MKRRAWRFGVKLGLVGTSCAVAAPLALADRSPLGESETFQIDASGERTTSAVQDGTIQTTVAANHESTSKYKLDIIYKVNITVVGNKTGTQAAALPDAYFAEGWLANLRATGHFESAEFKADHQGYEDVTTLDGHTYAHCDRVRIYDIKQEGSAALLALARPLLAPELTDATPKIENMVMEADLHAGIPALGAARIDVTGTVLGLSAKAGADYVSP